MECQPAATTWPGKALTSLPRSQARVVEGGSARDASPICSSSPPRASTPAGTRSAKPRPAGDSSDQARSTAWRTSCPRASGWRRAVASRSCFLVTHSRCPAGPSESPGPSDPSPPARRASSSRSEACQKARIAPVSAPSVSAPSASADRSGRRGSPDGAGAARPWSPRWPRTVSRYCSRISRALRRRPSASSSAPRRRVSRETSRAWVTGSARRRRRQAAGTPSARTWSTREVMPSLSQVIVSKQLASPGTRWRRRQRSGSAWGSSRVLTRGRSTVVPRPTTFSR